MHRRTPARMMRMGEALLRKARENALITAMIVGVLFTRFGIRG